MMDGNVVRYGRQLAKASMLRGRGPSRARRSLGGAGGVRALAEA